MLSIKYDDQIERKNSIFRLIYNRLVEIFLIEKNLDVLRLSERI